MRKSGKWMVLLDERILELLREDKDGFLTPTEIAEDKRIDYTPQYIGRRCKELANHGLVQEVSQSVYRITSKGEAYLKEEYDASETNGASVESSRADIEQGSDHTPTGSLDVPHRRAYP
jgi:predicted transcriptional regulator